MRIPKNAVKNQLMIFLRISYNFITRRLRKNLGNTYNDLRENIQIFRRFFSKIRPLGWMSHSVIASNICNWAIVVTYVNDRTAGLAVTWRATSCEGPTATQLGPKDLDDVEDRAAADRAGRVGTLVYADGAVVAQAHVSASVQHAVGRPFQTHRALVRRVVLRLRLSGDRIRCEVLRGQSDGGRTAGRPGSGRGRGRVRTSARDRRHGLCGRRRKRSHSGGKRRRRGHRRGRINPQCRQMWQGSRLLRRQWWRYLWRCCRGYGSYHRRRSRRWSVADSSNGFATRLPSWWTVDHTCKANQITTLQCKLLKLMHIQFRLTGLFGRISHLAFLPKLLETTSVRRFTGQMPFI